ncbi:MAG: TIR domain-containing protein [Candidatus Angelobacter sp.]
MLAPCPTVFVSHTSADDGFVRQLQHALADLGQPVWIDSRELRGGDPLWPVIQEAIQAAGAFAIVVSPASLQSKWVGKELKYALELQTQRGHQAFPVIPLSLDNTKLGVLEEFFGQEPLYIPVSTGSLDEALRAIAVALRLKLPAELPNPPQAPTLPLEELVLELTEPGFDVCDGTPRPKAKARLKYQPATAGKRTVETASSWEFIAPIGPIEAKEIRWYLEEYASWPSTVFKSRAANVEAQLAEWGRLLHEAALPAGRVSQVLQAWAGIGPLAERRFSVFLREGIAQESSEKQREAAAALLGLPWELLHEDGAFLFQGAKPTRVRRCLANIRSLDLMPANLPVRVLLITARPEDKDCGYIDHRASALPLVQAMESLGGLVELNLLQPPTFPALTRELNQARRAGTPYHVVHFDGHGCYSKHKGLGGLRFEDPQDSGKLEKRRHQTVYSDKLGPELRDYRIPLVFLDACQTAQAETAAGSVASALLQAGVASVVAMSHSVLVETARRFVQAFYSKLADGGRVGEAMLAGQRTLHDDDFRAQVFGAGALRLQDWFVPVLFQEEEDPPLFSRLPSRQARDITAQRQANALKHLPPEPETGFIGRSRELLALERLLFGNGARYAVIQGNGGEGKTALAAEFGRWLLRTRRIERAAFVSVERDGNAASVLNTLIEQLVVSTRVKQATADNLEPAILEVQRALEERPTLLIWDNMESLLPLPWLAESKDNVASSDINPSGILATENKAELAEILKLCRRLNPVGQTRIVFTSREALPQPYAAQANTRSLRGIGPEDAVRLVERVLREEGGLTDADKEEVDLLVSEVHCHARVLALLAPFITQLGVERTRESLSELMAEMHRRFPNSREQSLYASVELSLRRLSPEDRERARVLGLFHGGVNLNVLRHMMTWSEPETSSFGMALIAIGLATIVIPDIDYLRLDPALCPYLLALLEKQERATWQDLWDGSMRSYINNLEHESEKEAIKVATLTDWELPNLMALLEHASQAGNAEAMLDICISLFKLLQFRGKPRLLERIAKMRDIATQLLNEGCGNTDFDAQRIKIELALEFHQLPEALQSAQALYSQTLAIGEAPDKKGGYDIAMASWLLGRCLLISGDAASALPLQVDAQIRWDAIANNSKSRAAERMASVALNEQGHCHLALGQDTLAEKAYTQALSRAEQLRNLRDIEIGKYFLGEVWLKQQDYPKALAAFEQARDAFSDMGYPGNVADAWHHIGRVYQETDEFEKAEHAYSQSLRINEQLGDIGAQANTLNELGTINISDCLGSLENGAGYFQQAAHKFKHICDLANEGICRRNLAETLLRLKRYSEARTECLNAIALQEKYGHDVVPWVTWGLLSSIETADGQTLAASQARQKALELFLLFRRTGGEYLTISAVICTAMAEKLAADQVDVAAALLREFQNSPELPADFPPLLDALDAIIAGQRDPALADNPALTFDQAAEIILLLERLPPSGPTQSPQGCSPA